MVGRTRSSTLPLDGPLEIKLEGIDDMNAFIHQVSQTAVASFRARFPQR